MTINEPPNKGWPITKQIPVELFMLAYPHNPKTTNRTFAFIVANRRENDNTRAKIHLLSPRTSLAWDAFQTCLIYEPDSTCYKTSPVFLTIS